MAFRDYRRLLSRYTSESDEAVVWAVVDCRRDSQWILEHLSELQ